MFLTKVEPYLVVFWCWVLHREKIAFYHLVLLLIHIAGAIVLSVGDSFHVDVDQYGDLLLLGAVTLSSLSYIPAQRLTRKIGSLQTIFIQQGASGLFFLPFALFYGVTRAAQAGDRMFEGWMHIGLTVFFFNVLSTMLWYYSLRGTKAWLMSALRCLGPVVAAPIAWFIFEQRLSLEQLAGAAVVVITSVMMVADRRK